MFSFFIVGMKALLECILATTFASLVVCSVLRSGARDDEIAQYNPVGAPDSVEGYANLMNYLQSKQQELHPTQMKRRFTDFNMPYMKYKVDKRNNGIWIWMPAQGYVSVPHQTEDQDNALSKQGKIMRYGK